MVLAFWEFEITPFDRIQILKKLQDKKHYGWLLFPDYLNDYNFMK